MAHRCTILRRDGHGRVGYEGMPPPLPWSCGVGPVPVEDAFVAMVLAGSGWDGPPARHSPKGRTWKGWR
jgi:hypothetical protein